MRIQKVNNYVSMESNATFPMYSRLFLVWHPPNFLKSIYHLFHIVAHRHDTAPSLWTVNQSSWAWQSSQLFCCSVSNISWKFHWNPFTDFSVMLLVSIDPENIKHQLRFSLSYIRPVLKISWKFIYPFFCNVANRNGFPPPKKKSCMQGV